MWRSGLDRSYWQGREQELRSLSGIIVDSVSHLSLRRPVHRRSAISATTARTQARYAKPKNRADETFGADNFRVAVQKIRSENSPEHFPPVDVASWQGDRQFRSLAARCTR